MLFEFRAPAGFAHGSCALNKSMLVLGAKINSWGRFACRWWWLGLPAVLVSAIGANEWWRTRQFEAAHRAFQEDRLKDAQENIQSYLQARPDNAAAHLLAARLDRLLGSYAGAVKHLEECKRLSGMSADIQVENFL